MTMNAEQLAQFLATPEGLKTIRSQDAYRSLNSRAEPSKLEAPSPILEWNPILKDGALIFERADFFRGKPKVIKAEKSAGTLRVLIFGESVAAGFPLAPAFTPTTALEDILRSKADNPALIEVIDLSAPAMVPSDQLRVCEAAAQLGPDVCVFLQGHGWYLGLPLESTFPALDRVRESMVFEEGGLRASRARYLRELSVQAKTMAETLARLSHDMGAQSLFVIPGYNHQWERRTPPPILGGDQTAKWFELFEEAQEALMAKEYDKALILAAAMKTLEGLPLSSTPERIEAKVYQAQGQWDKACAAATAASDASTWHNHTWSMPQHNSEVTQAIQRAAAAYGSPVVDLREVFRIHWQTAFLDYRMFYDHLHYTVEAVQIAFTAVAEVIIGSPHGSGIAWNQEPFAKPSPPGILESSAAFQGVFWISQFCPPLLKDDLDDLLREILDPLSLDKNMLIVLKDFLRTRTLDCPPALHPAMVHASKIPGLSTVLGGKRLNPALVRSILNVLDAKGDTESHLILESLIEGYEAQFTEGVDLSQAFFRDWYWEFSAVAFNDSRQRHGSPYYKALWPESSFSFFAAGTTALSLELGARLPDRKAQAILEINGTVLGHADLQERWSTSRLEMKGIKRGLNTITVRWPRLSSDDRALAQLIEAYSLGRDADIFRIHGEIYSLRLQTI